jgi:phosphoribosylanthranilate isomerase
LDTLEIDVNRALGFKSRIPDDRVVIAESGISSAAVVQRYVQAGVNSFLIGEYLACHAHPAKALEELMTWIKVCGVRTPEQAEMIAACGATAIGINFWKGIPRHVSVHDAVRIAAAVRGVVSIVAVIVNADPALLARIRDQVHPDYIQCHGDETDAQVSVLGLRAYKAVGLASQEDVQRAFSAPGPFVLIDAKDVLQRGGTGKAPLDDLVMQVCAARPTLLAGGLTPDNVASAIARFTPMGVDTASGVESAPGIKDPDKTRDFVRFSQNAFG